jgi:ABC-type polysaccharide/polyol phosphate transport system ATPase subunit
VGHAAIRADAVEKVYGYGESASLGRTLRRLLRRSHREPLHALAGVSFEIRQGECFGIVGGNGSGKSTLLQVVSGITPPSGGAVDVRGVVLPLLAVGTGFHPELTGAENVVLFGTILGLSRATITERLGHILEFAGLHGHRDTPVKRYSDGMQARLSFAVGMLFPADIYLFDEVLAVVDGDFRDRCLGEIRGMVASDRTVVFISHDLDQVAELCDRVMWLEHGRVREVGETATVLSSYRTFGAPESVD